MKKALVTGVNGFVGAHLINELVASNYSVIGVGLEQTPQYNVKDKIDTYLSVNLIDTWPDISEVDIVIHLAGFSSVGPSYDEPQLYINGNTAMVINMAELYLKQERKPRIIVISSGAIYDNSQSIPINESGRIGFTSPYAVSKVAVENLSSYYRERGLDIIIARPFNHVGPGQNGGFLIPDLYKRIKTLNCNNNRIFVGNLTTRRDYTDVRDVASAYVLLADSNHLNHTTYNICSGLSISGKEILDIIKKEVSREDVKTIVDQALIRPTDIHEIKGDSSRLVQDTGWVKKYNILESIHDFVISQGENS
ncbi:GDP-mannose 4,6-dehydratase [Enterococcus avium]|nr:GDP-mannose 4,6-dehydratase [Enterococcus avium]